jgi:hypothetical protein
MKIVLLPLLFLSFSCLGQSPNSNSSIIETVNPSYCQPTDSTEWKLLQRPTPKNPLKTWYSITYSEDCGYKFLLKISLEGINFIIPQDTEIEIVSETGASLSISTENKLRSCKGCGSIDKEDDKPGVTVSCSLSKADLRFLYNNYPEHIRLYLPNITYGGRINILKSEMFCEQIGIASKFATANTH